MLRLASPLVLLLAACAGAPPAPGPDELVARYPEARFVRGIGYAAFTDRADRPEARRRAESEAQARVAEQVRSRVRARLKVSSRADDRGRAYEEVEQQVETQALFERGELIRVVQKATRCRDGRCEALAVLARADAVGAFEQAYDARRPGLHASLAGAEGAADDPAAFTAHFRAAALDLELLGAIAARIEVLGRGRYGPHVDDRARFDALVERARLLRDAPVQLATAGLPAGGMGDAVARALTRGFRDLGLTAVPAASCDGEGRFGFEPEARVECRAGPLGRTCRLHLSAALRDCARDVEVARFDFTDVPLRAAHPRDEAHARRQLEARLANASFTAPLRRGLEGVLPLERAE